MASLSPDEVEKWLLGLKSLLSGDVVRELANEVRRSQIDGDAFGELVASRTTPASLRDAVRPSHMATLRRCWNNERPQRKLVEKAIDTGGGGVGSREEKEVSRVQPRPDQPKTEPGRSRPEGSRRQLADPPAAQQRSLFAPPPRACQPPAAFVPPAALDFEEEHASLPREEASPGSDEKEEPPFRFEAGLPGDCLDKAVRPSQVPRLDLSTLHAKEGKSGILANLGTDVWMKPGKHQWTDMGPQYPPPAIKPEGREPAHRRNATEPIKKIEGFACATCEDQQRIAEFYGYRDEGFVATMHGLKTDCIRPRLYLGTMADAAYWPLLQSLGVTHILNVAIEAQRAQPPFESQGIQYMMVPWHDSAEQAHSLNRQRFRTLRGATRYIDQSLKAMYEVKGSEKKASVLVHCVQGINRSAAVVCAYLMEYEGVSLDRALSEVRNKHLGCLSSRHWQELLHKFNAELMRGI